jgi:hypothetical protein
MHIAYYNTIFSVVDMHMDNQEKLSTLDTQRRRQNKTYNSVCVGHIILKQTQITIVDI